jgi:uncharacterized Zn finger protein (UPF0148 family)
MWSHREKGKPMNDKPCKNCGSYGGNVGCDVCGPPIRKRKAEERLARTDSSPREWRSAVFWYSDIEDIMDRIANEAMGYHPESRAEFFRDVMAAIKDHLANACLSHGEGEKRP